jgi:hypothetical protein
MMKLTMTVGADGDGIVDLVGAAIQKRPDVMDLKEWIAIVMLERRWTVTYFTNTLRPLKNPGVYFGVPDETGRAP